jgi:hypothetical protein
MTTAIATMKRSEQKAGIRRAARRLGEALAALGDRIAAWSARYFEKEVGEGLGEALEALSPERRIEAALRWHARQRHVL